MKTTSFKEKVFLITGASSGIGEALALALGRLGAKMILCSRNKGALDRVKASCAGNQNNIHTLSLDLTIASDIEAKAHEALNKWGEIDYLIHNAGIAARDSANHTSMDVNRLVMETNYFGTVALTKMILPWMIEAGKGHIIVISSLAGQFGVPMLSAYSASKHALQGYFESLRSEIKNSKLTVSIIVPGFVNTPILIKATDGQGKIPGTNLSVNEKGMSAAACAEKILKAVAGGRSKTFIGSAAVAGFYMHRLMPSLLAKIISSHPLKKMRSLNAGFKIFFFRAMKKTH